jgi:hypothetical protein
MSFESLNTFTEASAAISYAKAKELSTITVMATPSHQLGAFISFVSVLLNGDPRLRVYNQVGDSMP